MRKKEFEQIEIFHPEINRDVILAMNHFKYLKFSYTVPQSVIHPHLGQGQKSLFQSEGFQLDSRKVILAHFAKRTSALSLIGLKGWWTPAALTHVPLWVG